MGMQDDIMARDNLRRHHARNLAVMAELLRECPNHEGEFFLTGNSIDDPDLLKLVSEIYNSGELYAIFDGVEDAMGVIRDEVESISATECPSCANRDRQLDKIACKEY